MSLKSRKHFDDGYWAYKLTASFTSRVIHLEEGQLIVDGDARKILHQFTRYRTQIALLFPETD